MLVSVGAYTLLWGWQFAALFVLLLFVHELGHAIWLRAEGVKAGLPIFVPFLGAVIAMKEMPRNAWVEAKVGLAGPILGSAGAAAVWFLGEAHELGPPARRGLHRVPAEPLQPDPDHPARRRPSGGGAAPGALDRRPGGSRRADGAAPEPVPAPDPGARRPRRLAPLARPLLGQSRGRRVLHGPAVAAGGGAVTYVGLVGALVVALHAAYVPQ